MKTTSDIEIKIIVGESMAILEYSDLILRITNAPKYVIDLYPTLEEDILEFYPREELHQLYIDCDLNHEFNSRNLFLVNIKRDYLMINTWEGITIEFFLPEGTIVPHDLGMSMPIGFIEKISNLLISLIVN